MADADQMKTALTHALLVLKNKTAPNTRDVRDAAAAVAGLMALTGATIAAEHLVRHIEASINVHIGEPSVIDNREDDHQAWLPARRGSIKWSFWERYRWHLEKKNGASRAR